MSMTPSLHTELKNRFGFDTFKGNQEAIIQNVIDGRDTFVLMPTGGGVNRSAISYPRLYSRYRYRDLAIDSFDEKPGGCNERIQ
ncbi:hypothetical protein MASR1M31_12180 [Porphyromonadaceae bacterium]